MDGIDCSKAVDTVKQIYNFLPSLEQAILSLITSMAFEEPGLPLIFLLVLPMSGPLL